MSDPAFIVAQQAEAGTVVCRQHVQHVAPFCRALRKQLERAGLNQEQVEAVFETSVSAECIGCQIPLGGGELLKLSHEQLAESAHPKLKRLHLGFCARQGCEACYYRLSFRTYPRIDWGKTLADLKPFELSGEPASATDALCGPRENLLAAMNAVIPRRAWFVATGLVILWMFHQWYVGGRIPILREPEHFRVTPGSDAGLTENPP